MSPVHLRLIALATAETACLVVAAFAYLNDNMPVLIVAVIGAVLLSAMVMQTAIAMGREQRAKRRR